MPFNNNLAELEGWALFECEGRYQLQRDDEAGQFASDADAIIFVANLASAGSAYHRSALELIGALTEP